MIDKSVQTSPTKLEMSGLSDSVKKGTLLNAVPARIMLLNARRIQSDFGPDLILLAIEDVTHRSRTDTQPGETQKPGSGSA